MESETGHHLKASRRSTVIIALFVAFALGSAGLYLSRDTYAENEIRRLIAAAYDSQRPGGGRLSHAPYSERGGVLQAKADLGQAQLLLLRCPESDTRQQLQALIYLASGNW